MTEYNSFSPSIMKNMCRACLRVTEEVYPMTPMEINAFESFTNQVSISRWEMDLCLACRWMLHKCMKFTHQCQKANEMLNQHVKEDSESHLFPQPTYICDLRISKLDTYSFGPEDNLEFNRENDYAVIDDNIEDDDEIPLVMLQDDYKNKKIKAEYNESAAFSESEVKQEPEVKEEYTKDFSGRVRRKQKKKQLKEGFSSRMVQETDEYIVIKLTREQVLSEMAEKAKIESYLRSPYKCMKCVKGFNFEDVLQTHMERHTMEHGTYQCDICTQYCPSPVSLRGHMKSHNTRYECKLCGQVRLSRQHLLEHHEIAHTTAPTTYTCDKCNFTTIKRTVIQRHVKTHAVSERHACHRCGKLFNTIESLRIHTIRHDKSKRLQCPHCVKQFIYPSLLHKHVQAVHERKDYYCVECDVRFKSPDTLRLHFKKAKRHRDSSSYKYFCRHCSQRFVSTATLSVHLSSSHGEPKQHACEECRRLYSSREALRAHVWRVHQKREQTVSCHLCEKTFTRKSILKVHLRSHSHVCARAGLKGHHADKHQEKGVLPGIEDSSTIPQEG